MVTADVVVIGLGGMGAAAALRLAERGARVVGFEQFDFVHDRGSSHGESRIIRQAYFEHPDYVPLLRSAYDQWRELEARSGEKLLFETGVLMVGPADGEAVFGTLNTAATHGIPIERLTGREAQSRWPGLQFRDADTVVFEPGAGYLPVERCVASCLQHARNAGAELYDRTSVLGWTDSGNHLRVTTTAGEFATSAIVITAGAWTNRIAARLRLPLSVVRKFVGWFPIEPARRLAALQLPPYFFETTAGWFYGLPTLDGRTLKISRHSGGEPVGVPDDVPRDVLPDDVPPLQDFIATHVPAATTTLDRHQVCLYTLTPDQHFAIGTDPGDSRVVFAAGFSGHGFKFAMVTGDILADLALQGSTRHPIEFLSPRRFADATTSSD